MLTGQIEMRRAGQIHATEQRLFRSTSAWIQRLPNFVTERFSDQERTDLESLRKFLRSQDLHQQDIKDALALVETLIENEIVVEQEHYYSQLNASHGAVAPHLQTGRVTDFAPAHPSSYRTDAPIQLNASDFYTLFRPSECELRVYLQEQQNELEGELSPYEDVIRRLGKRHEDIHLASFANVMDLRPFQGRERAAATLRAMSDRQPVIYQPLFIILAEIAGARCEVWGEPDFLLLDTDGRYIIRDVKIARRITQVDHPEILLQMQLYGWLYRQLHGTEPSRLEVFNGANEIVRVYDDDSNALMQQMERLARIKILDLEPYCPVGWTKCKACSFEQRCWSNAKRSQDPAILIGVDQELAKVLQNAGVLTVEQLLSEFDESKLSNLERSFGTKVQRVGSRARSILQMAQALSKNSPIPLQVPELPNAQNYVMLDLEGLPPHLDDLEKVYLWDMQVFGTNPGQFMPAVANFGSGGDKQGWQDFLNNARQVFEEYGDVPFIHWHHYERVKLDMYIERHGDSNGIAARVRRNLLDLLPITMQSVALPLPSYSLKVVEQFVGFQRTQEEFGGNWAMAKYIEAIESVDDELRKIVIDQILLYNREDLEATWAVFQWLKNLFDIVPSQNSVCPSKLTLNCGGVNSGFSLWCDFRKQRNRLIWCSMHQF